MRFNKISPMFSNKDKYAEDSFSEPNDQQQDFTDIAKKVFSTAGIIEYSDDEINKWLISADFNAEKAMESLKETLEWRNSFQLNAVLHHDYSDIDSHNSLFFKGKALDESKLLWWIGSRHISHSNPISKEREIKYLIKTFEKGRKQKSFNDRFSLVIDLYGVKSEKSDINFIFNMVSLLGKHYPETISKIYVFPKSSFNVMFLKMACYNLRPEINTRINISPGPEIMFGSISPDNILRKYGGKLSDDNICDTHTINDATDHVPKDMNASLDKVTKNVIKIEQIWIAPDDD